MTRFKTRALGQHFLTNAGVVQKILKETEAGLRADTKYIVEVGIGKLVLTKPLEHLCHQHKIDLLLVERDPILVNELKEHSPLLGERCQLMDAGSSTFFETLTNLKQPFFFVSNLPYSAAAPILAQVVRASALCHGALVMVQKEMGDRIVAEPGTKDRGALSLLVQSAFRAKKLFDVSPGSFSPPPQVDSSVLRLDPRSDSFYRELKNHLAFESFCKKIFTQRRKMIRRILASSYSENDFLSLGIDPKLRPEDLSLEQVHALFLLM